MTTFDAVRSNSNAHSKQPRLKKAEIPIPVENNVVEHPDAKYFACLPKLPRGLFVRGRWLKTARWMVVSNDDTGRTVHYHVGKHLVAGKGLRALNANS